MRDVSTPEQPGHGRPASSTTPDRPRDEQPPARPRPAQGPGPQGPGPQGSDQQGSGGQNAEPRTAGSNASQQGNGRPAPSPQGAPQQGPARGRPAQQGPNQQGPNQQGPNQQGPNQQGPNQQGPRGPRPPQSGGPGPSGPGPQQGSGPAGDSREAQKQPQTNLQTHTSKEHEATRTDVPRVKDEPRTSRPDDAAAKAAGIDGPTRNIARNALPTDMPDLSTVRHPGYEESPRSERVATAARPTVTSDPLRATVQIRKLDPWSTLKLSLVVSVSLFFVWMVAVGLLYMVLDGMGVWDRLNNAFSDIVATSGDAGLVSAGQIFGYAAAIGLINVVLFTALTTVGTFIYNMSSDLVGGLEVTLADRD